MEVFAGFLFGWAVSWYGLLGLALLCLFSESTDSHYWAFLFGALLIFTGVLYTGVTLTGGQIALAAALYLPVGIAWSVFRYKREIARVVLATKDERIGRQQEALARYAPDRMTESFVAWTMLWPVSFIENFVGDVVNTVRIAITTYFKGVYKRIWQTAYDNVESKVQS